MVSNAADIIESTATSSALAPVYAGDVVHSDGSVTVYVTSNGVNTMRAALDAALGSSSTSAFTLTTVTHNYAYLDNLTQRLFLDRDSLAADGLDIVHWGPDPTTNTVAVQVAGYTPATATALESQYPADAITVSAAPLALPSRFSNRYFDSSPYDGGARVLFDNDFAPSAPHCTDDFAFTGNASGKTFNLTAGHCEGSSVWTNFAKHQEIGPISTNYFSPTSGWDMESFPCNCTSYVWYDPPSTTQTDVGQAHHVIGPCTTCGVNQLVTTDGAEIGETTGNRVTQLDICQTFSDGIATCHLDQAVNDNGKQICTEGDSGGPVYQRSSNNTAYAAGLIVGGYSIDDCFYEDWHLMAVHVNGTVKTN